MADAGKQTDELYGLALEEFTKARNELAKRLRAEGDKDAAAEVAELRKPSRPAWAINRAARERPELADAVLDAAGDLAAAQEAVVAGSARETLDEAVSAERAAVEALVAAAKAELEAIGSGSAAMVDRVRRTLHAVAGDPDLQAELGSARVVADREPVGFGGAPAVAPARRSPAAKPKPREKGATKKGAEREEARREREARAEAERESRRRLTEARRRAQQAERRFEKRGRDVERARERLDDARRAAVAAEEEVAELAEDLQRRRRELEDARAVLEELS